MEKTITEIQTETELSSPVYLSELRKHTLSELYSIGEKLGIENIYNFYRKSDVIYQIINNLLNRGIEIVVEGVLEVLPEGFGFLGLTIIIIFQVQKTYMFLHPR